MKKVLVVVLLTLTLCLNFPMAFAETEGEAWTLVTPEGTVITRIGTEVSVGDEYISGDNTLYRVTEVDTEKREAIVQKVGEERAISQAFFELRKTAVSTKRIGLYCTHSDESYEDGDGTSSIETGWAGIHDVAATLKSWLEDKDIEVLFDTGSYLPHDAGAYRRSRTAMVDLVKQGPAAIFDVHRDGIPDPEEYRSEVNGTPVTMVRLLVGRSNPNSAENRQFAVQLKSVADEVYPGLIKDIFIGKGNYNQELMPDSVLLEFGTHVSDKEEVLASTEYMADVINMTVFGGPAGYSKKAQAQEEGSASSSAATPAPGTISPSVTQQSARTQSEESSGTWTAIAWIVGVAVVALLAFMVVANGGFAGLGDRMRRFSSEVSGGLFGKRPKE